MSLIAFFLRFNFLVHIRDRGLHPNEIMKKRSWSGVDIALAVFLTLFCGLIPGIVYIVMKNKVLKQKNRIVYDHNMRIFNNHVPEVDISTQNDIQHI